MNDVTDRQKNRQSSGYKACQVLSSLENIVLEKTLCRKDFTRNLRFLYNNDCNYCNSKEPFSKREMVQLKRQHVSGYINGCFPSFYQTRILLTSKSPRGFAMSRVPTSPMPHSKQWSRAINQPPYMTTERPAILDLVKLQNFMFQFQFELFTLFFLSFLFQFLLQWIQIIFSEKNSNKLLENKLVAMGKTAKGERKTTGSFIIENNENIFK